VVCHYCFDISVGDHQGPSVSGTNMKDLAGAYLSQGSGIGQGLLCCPAARKVIHELAFEDKQLSVSLMTNA